jgi:polysaccharide pyruvyl transferase CsaB
LVENVRSVSPDVVITVASEDPFYTEKLHKVKSVPKNDFAVLNRNIEKSDLVVLGGGGLFQDHHRMMISQFFESGKYGTTSYATVPLMGTINRKPVIYYAQGIGPLFSNEAYLFSRWALGLADYITVRDEYSYDLATELLDVDRSRIALSFDPVIKAGIPSGERCKAVMIQNRVPQDRKLVIVAPRFWMDKKLQTRVVAELTASLDEFIGDNNDYHVVLVPFDRFTEYENDIGICEDISTRLHGHASVIRDYDTYQEILSMYLLADFSIGMRYHSLIFSALTSTPVIAVSYDKKDSELMRDLDLADFSVEMKDIERSRITDLIEKILISRSLFRENLVKRVGGIVGSRHDSCLILQKRLEGLSCDR